MGPTSNPSAALAASFASDPIAFDGGRSTSSPQGDALPETELENTRSADAPRLIYDPTLRQTSMERFEVTGRRDDSSVIAWGFWGGLLALVVAVGLVIGAQNVYSVWDIAWAVAALAVGLLFYRFGRRSSTCEELLCEIDLGREALSWPTDGPGEGVLTVGFDAITELVFGMTRYPVSEKRRDVDVHAFTLLVRDDDERLVPVVEASPDKEAVHEIAKFLAQQLRTHITYVGVGIK